MTTINPETILRDLGDGLILRRSTPEDADALSEFNGSIHSRDVSETSVERIGISTWTRDLLTRPHPTFSPDDFTIVEDTKISKIVSSLNLISQTWAYNGIPFKVGRPEIVGTLPDYRGRGLVRAQFEAIHEWSRERGELVQGITGIPYYYRQFGYEMALELGGAYSGYEIHVPKLKEDESEQFTFHLATEADIPFLIKVSEYGAKRKLVSAVWDDTLWRYEISGKSEKHINRYEVHLIKAVESKELVGYVMIPWANWGDGIVLRAVDYELKPGISWLEVTPAVARWLWETGKARAEKEEKALVSFGFSGGSSHPAYEVMRDLLPRVHEPYAWYIRVPDLAGFIRHIAPVLEKRIEGSIIPGYSGELKIAFYRSGLKMVWEKGKLEEAENLPLTNHEGTPAAFPYLTFLNMVFGRCTFEELKAQYPDCYWETDEVRLLLNTLFPKKPSSVMGIS